MAQLTWGDPRERRYEAGVDRGVLYMEDCRGVAWNGLISVTERTARAVEAVFYEGVKVNDIVTNESLSAVLRAYTYPDEFMAFDGVGEVEETGVFLLNQPLPRFGLSYRSWIGEPGDTQAGYKIHLWYNLTAIPSDTVRETLSDSPNPIVFEWSINSVPEPADGYVNTGHVVINSLKTNPYFLEFMETMLYGNAERDPCLPSLNWVLGQVRNWVIFEVIDNGDGTWTAIAHTTDPNNSIRMLDADTFEITAESAVFLTPDLYEISTVTNEREDAEP